MPVGALVTRPGPFVETVTDGKSGSETNAGIWARCWARIVSRVLAVNVAVTALSPSIVTVHGSVPVQAPLQPAKSENASAVAVSLTVARGAVETEHTDPQSIVGAGLATTPPPSPAFATVSRGCSANEAAVESAPVCPAASNGRTVYVYVVAG